VTLDGATLVREREAAGELTQQREQRQVRPCGGLEPMRLRLRDGDNTTGDGGPQGWLELAEGDLPLHDSAQVVLIEVEELHQRREFSSRVVAETGSLDRRPGRLAGNARPAFRRVGLPAWARPRCYAPSASAALS
jgi:hypothetical protein